jgi:uncharacterized membrane protein
MRHGNIILLAAVLSLAALLVAAVPGLAGNATAVPSPGPTMTDDVVAADQVAKVADYGLVTTAASPGGTITGYAVIQNTGKDMIRDAMIHLDVFEPRKNAHAIRVATLDRPLSNLDIAPGDQKRAEFSINLPARVNAGEYSLQATVIANGQQAETFTMPVTVS